MLSPFPVKVLNTGLLVYKVAHKMGAVKELFKNCRCPVDRLIQEKIFKPILP
jgi:hypothetical protein